MAIDPIQLGSEGLILEGIVTTTNADGTVNISPMGPIVSQQIHQFIFRPFQTSTTYKNLKRESGGVFHVTDDVLLFAQAAVGQPDPVPPLDGLVLTDACRWFRFEVRSLDDSDERTHIVAETVETGTNRDFFGFNRAKHAVLEAAILATRVHMLDAEELLAEFHRLETSIKKTASADELRAFNFLKKYVKDKLRQAASAEPAQ